METSTHTTILHPPCFDLSGLSPWIYSFYSTPYIPCWCQINPFICIPLSLISSSFTYQDPSHRLYPLGELSKCIYWLCLTLVHLQGFVSLYLIFELVIMFPFHLHSNSTHKPHIHWFIDSLESEKNVSFWPQLPCF